MAFKLPRKIAERFSKDIGIDLGTANTLVYLKGKGIVITEPSVVALNQKTGQVVAVGASARDMIGRTPTHITAIRPLVEGVISDFEVTEEMLTYLIQKAQTERMLLGPRVVIGVPSGITNVEIRAVRDAAKNAGAREVLIIEEPMAAALGARLPVESAVGTMLVDIGGGTTDIALMSLGGIVRAKNIRIAGDVLNDDIASYIRSEFKILIGERTAEDVKVAVGSAIKLPVALETHIRGRDLVTGLPREIVITDADIREATGSSIISIVEAIKEVIETAPPEVVSDVMRLGIFLTGGGALLRGLPELLASELKVPIHVVDDPLTTVVRGTGIVLEDVEKYRAVLVDDDDGVLAGF
ncbi:MAG: rod shape-determining protein [Candidatus Paceibacterota bacterium]|nr:rod shape-determining protein [Candidatus Paceibacterota bacterium]MBP9832027.1 rod shape-determining protein [Candidatus Paceibacterota bacterium]